MAEQKSAGEKRLTKFPFFHACYTLSICIENWWWYFLPIHASVNLYGKCLLLNLQKQMTLHFKILISYHFLSLWDQANRCNSRCFRAKVVDIELPPNTWWRLFLVTKRHLTCKNLVTHNWCKYLASRQQIALNVSSQ